MLPDNIYSGVYDRLWFLGRFFKSTKIYPLFLYFVSLFFLPSRLSEAVGQKGVALTGVEVPSPDFFGNRGSGCLVVCFSPWNERYNQYITAVRVYIIKIKIHSY